MCRNCSGFSPVEHVVYATAELHAVEYENGILAMEFAAPVAGEAVLQLAREPVGPLLAAGKPTTFDFDEKTLRARFAGFPMRIGKPRRCVISASPVLGSRPARRRRLRRNRFTSPCRTRTVQA